MRRQLENGLDALQRAADVVREAGWRVQAHARRNLATLQPGHAGRTGAVSVRWPRAYGGPWADKWAEHVRRGLSERARLEVVEIPQPFENVVLFEVGYAGRRVPVALDYADSPALDAACAREVALYFKMQHRRGGYPVRHARPGGYVPGSPHVYDYLAPVRAARDEHRFRFDVLGRFSLDFAEGTRRPALSALEAQTRFRFHGGARPVRYSRFLDEVAHSRVCVDLPGNGDFCFRLVDYLAVGTAVVAVRHGNCLPADLVDGEHLVYVRPDLSDLVDTCAALVEDPARCEHLARNARHYFDTFLHRRALADYYLRECCTALGATTSPSPF